MFLGIEIGGTKLQLGVGSGTSASLVELTRCDIDRSAGASGILRDIQRIGGELVDRYRIERVGIGFGGPVDREAGTVITSHQVAGWDSFPLVEWCRDKLGIDAIVVNDCDAAALAEASFGAGAGVSPVLYVTVGTGIGAGLVVNGRIYHGQGYGAAEIGHLRTIQTDSGRAETVESICSGPAIAERVRRSLDNAAIRGEEARLLEVLQLCQGDLERLTAKDAATLALAGDEPACEAFRKATNTLGWGIAQAVTLFAPACVVVGGGVSLAGDSIFFEPLAASVRRHVISTFRDSFELRAAELAEEMVVYGALTIAAESSKRFTRRPDAAAVRLDR